MRISVNRERRHGCVRIAARGKVLDKRVDVAERPIEVAHGVAKADAYTLTVHLMAVLLVVGFICNLLVKRVDDKHHMTEAQLAAEK